MTFAPVGPPIYSNGASFTLDPVAVGDFMIAEVIVESTTVFPTGLGSPNVTWGCLVPATAVGSNYIGLFIGVVTNANAFTTTLFTNVGSAGPFRTIIQEFSTTVGWQNVGFDKFGSINASTNTYPSLTPAHGAGELYFGYALDAATASPGSTAGYTYYVDSNGDGLCYNPACTSGAQAPVWGDTNSRQGIAVLVYEQAIASFDTPAVLPPFALAGTNNDVRTELDLGTLGWTDISTFVLETTDQAASRGKPDESTSNTPGNLTLQLNNADGRFYDNNPLGPYYGNLGRNTQLRISVPEGATYLRLRDDPFSEIQGAATVNPAGDIDVQFDVTMDNWRPPGGWLLGGKWSSGQQSWTVLIQQSGAIEFIYSTTGSNSFSFASSKAIPVPAGRRQLIRVTYNHNGGIDMYYSPPGLTTPVWTHIDGSGAVSGALFASTSVIEVGNVGAQPQNGMNGKVHAMRLISGSLPSAGNPSSLFTSASNGGAVTWASNPTAGQKVLVAVWTAAGETITSAVDNGTSPTTFTADIGPIANSAGQQLTIFRGDNITLPASGSYTVTITCSGAHAVAAIGKAYSGLAAGPPPPGGVNAFYSTTGTGVSTNGSKLMVGGPLCTFAAFTTDVTSTTTISAAGGGFFNIGTEVTGGSFPVGAAADNLQNGNSAGTNYIPSWTVGASASWVAAQVTYPYAGTVVASPDLTAQAAGVTSFSDAESNTWTTSGNAFITNRHYRFWGETSAFPTTWNTTGKSVIIALQAAGILRRLTQSASQQVFQSPLRRAWPSLPDLVAYWPMEDGNSQGFGFSSSVTPLSFAAVTPDTPIGTYSGTPAFASNSDFQCSLGLPAFSGAIYNFPIPGNRVADTANVVRFLLEMPAGGEPASIPSPGTGAFLPIVTLLTTGTGAKMIVGVQPINQQTTGGPITTGITIEVYNSGGTQIGAFTMSVTPGGEVAYQGIPLWISMEMYQSGSNVQFNLGIQVVGQPIAYYEGTTFVGTLGQGTQIICGSGGNLQDTAIGHLTYQRAFHDMSAGEYSSQIAAWAGETAGNRFQRLCNEQNIPFVSRGNLADTQPMGVQTTIDVMSLLQECVDADRGMWWEPPYKLALGYRTLADLLNQPPCVQIPYAASELAGDQGGSSNEDDQFIINDAIVVNTYTGGQAEVAVTDGPLSNQAPPNGVGTYEAQPQVNLFQDSQCADSAGWITWVGTAADLRYPTMPFHMKRLSAATYFALQEADLGDRVQVVTPPANGPAPAETAAPSWLPPSSLTSYARGGMDVLVNNLQTALNVRKYDVVITGVPTTPYLCAQVDDPVHGRAGTPGSYLSTPQGSGDTTLNIATQGDSWSTAAGDVPFDLGIGGEQITVTAIGAVLANWINLNNAQNSGFEGGIGTWTSTGSPACTLADTAAQAHTGSNSMQMTSGGTAQMQAANCSLANTPTQGLPVTPGDIVSGSIWFRSAAVAESCKVGIDWCLNGAQVGSTSFGTPITDSTTGWTQALVSNVTVPAGVNRARLRAFVTTAGSGEVHYVDDAILVNVSAGTQQFTVIRSQNGITKAQTVTTDVDLYTLPVASL